MKLQWTAAESPNHCRFEGGSERPGAQLGPTRAIREGTLMRHLSAVRRQLALAGTHFIWPTQLISDFPLEWLRHSQLDQRKRVLTVIDLESRNEEGWRTLSKGCMRLTHTPDSPPTPKPRLLPPKQSIRPPKARTNGPNLARATGPHFTRSARVLLSSCHGTLISGAVHKAPNPMINWSLWR